MFRTGVTIAAAALALAATAGSAQAGCQMQQIAEYHITMDGNQPLVDATINGHPVRFVVDLGDWMTTLAGPSTERLRLPTRSFLDGDFKVYGVGGSASTALARVDDFALGPIDQKNIEMLVTGNRPLSSLAVGLLGRELLTHNDVEFDLGRNVMRLIEADGCHDEVVYWANAYSMAPMKDGRRGAAVEIDVRLNGHTVLAGMDTGASTTIVTPDAAEAAGVKPEMGGDGKSQTTGGIGNFRESATVATFSTFEVGGETINNAKLVVADMFGHDIYKDTSSRIAQKLDGQPDMLLGADFFLSHRVYIARSQGKVYFTYNGGPVFQVVAPRLAGADDLAIKDDDEAIALNPTDAGAVSDRGMLYFAKGEYEKAVADADRAIALKPGDPVYLDESCWTRAWAGRELDKALADCNAARARNPNAMAVLYNRSFVYFRLGLFDKSIADSDLALKIEPKNRDGLYVRGLAKRRKGDTAGGDADIAAAKAINPSIADRYAKAGVTP